MAYGEFRAIGIGKKLCVNGKKEQRFAAIILAVP
jgi:hypothetical protein